MASKTDFGKSVLKKLIDEDKTTKWLQDEITARTGLFVDASYLNKALTGQYVSPRIIESIVDITGVEYSVNEDQSKKPDN